MSLCYYEMTLLNEKINEIAKLIKSQNFDNFNKDAIIKMSDTNIILFLNFLVRCIQHHEFYKYKFSHYEKTVKLMVDIIIESNKNIDLTFNDFLILKVISNVTNSHIQLKRLNKIIIDNKYYNIDILIYAAEKSTLPIFLFWWNICYKNNDHINILKYGIVNTDDRIYQYILDQNKNYTYTENNKQVILSKIFSTSYIIPRKHIQKKLKILSLHMDLSTQLNFMLTLTNNPKIIKTIIIYYYKVTLSFESLKILVSNCCSQYILAHFIYNELKSQDEKYNFALLCNLNGFYHTNICIKNIKTNTLDENNEYIIEKLISQLYVIYDFTNFSKGLNNILQYYKNNNMLQNYILKYSSNQNTLDLIKYLKFFVFPETVYKHILVINIKINKILHLMRCSLKRYVNNKLNNFNYKFKKIINEIKYFKPNNKFKILNNGSLHYQFNFQKYNNIPPRHLLPLEYILNNNYLIKEKADGILTFTLPIKIYPFINDIYNYEIKAEFIEELNVYLIFDINIPNTTIIERYEYLRSIHPETKNIKYNFNVSNFEILIDEIKKEREIFKNFIKKSKNNYIWYPKCAWNIFMNNDFYKNIISIIEENNINLNFILNGEFKCDGLILTPLNGSRELKIKPKKLQTIDLLYNNEKWLDSNNIEWSIEKIPDKEYQNKIYRCYPFENKYIATEIRYDKKKPNTFKIIDQIQNIKKFNWMENININEPYYELSNNINDPFLINILNNQKELLYNTINKINPEINKNWLDLGCGKCKLYNIIKNIYIPKKYTGIDSDIKILSKKYYIIDDLNNIVSLYPCNLNEKWDKINLWNTFDWTIKYNYIIANFSIMYFWSDLFWEQLNRVSDLNTILIFNVVKENVNWSYNNSYLTSDNENTKIYFKWTHTKEHYEKLISDKLINDTLIKYNWKIKNKFSPDNCLGSCYNWFIIIKI